METIDEKQIPLLSVNFEEVEPQTQDSFCGHSLCDLELLDCDCCLFDSKRCPVEIFDKWLNRKKDGK